MPKEIPEWRKVLDRFELACKEYYWVGIMHPSFHAPVEREYQDAKNAIINFMKGK
jgi:hypothetical protein